MLNGFKSFDLKPKFFIFYINYPYLYPPLQFIFKDALTPVLEESAQVDGLVLGSPIYFGEVTGQMRAFLERLAFSWLSYNDYSLTAPKRIPLVLVETT